MSKVKEIFEFIKKCLPKRRPIEHHEPFIDKYKAHQYVIDAFNRGITGYEYLDLFNDKLREITKAKFCILTSSGTNALELAIRSLDIIDGNILVPSATFIATVNAIVHSGNTPYFIDGIPLTPYRLKKFLENNENIKAVIIVHLFGIPNDIEGIVKVAKEYNVKVIEDAAQALGSSIDGKHCGTIADIGIYSFNNNKIITTNGGGA